MHFDEFQGSGPCRRIAGVADAVSPNGDPCAVGILFLGPYFADYPSVRDIEFAVIGNIRVVDGFEGVCAFNALLSRVGWVLSDALAEPSEFVGI